MRSHTEKRMTENEAEQGSNLKQGGPCCVCGATRSSTWYGKKGTPGAPGLKYCRSNACKLQGGYVTRNRKRRCADDCSSNSSTTVVWASRAPQMFYKLSKIEACLGMRCVHVLRLPCLPTDSPCCAWSSH